MVTLEISPQVKALPPGMGIPLWVGERCRAGLSLLLSIQQGGFARSAFQTTKCISNISIIVYVFPIL